MDWNFSHNIYTAMSDNKLAKVAINTAIIYRLWRVYSDIYVPVFEEIWSEAFHLNKDIFRPPSFDTTEPFDPLVRE